MRGLLWVFAALLILSNLGYDITALMAGLGIGGIAIALALQNVLEDIFSSLSIYFDKPFVVGDFIILGDDLGEVQKIGIKTTRIKHLQGQELVVSNKELTSTRIHNYGKMKKRRVVFDFGVVYDTPVKKLKKIPDIIKNVVESAGPTTFDRAHFKKFWESSLNFEVVYYITGSDYNAYMDIQESINLAIMEEFESMGVEFAYPTQTVYLNKS
jgi:small-conductance mechanosensitive channel